MKDTLTDQTWREIIKRKEEFQKIVGLLVEFDERTGRYQSYGDPEAHFMRKAVSVCRPDDLRVFAKNLGNYVYYVVTELVGSGGHVATGWIHEDGIRAEREGAASGHPVHRIICLTDLFQDSSQKLDEDILEACVEPSTLAIMAVSP
ncbi:MAG: hypothetical protein HY042_04285 [Spirochaetia bacterium]|nr:hypothetical protein [Spirochaetia bacterium]